MNQFRHLQFGHRLRMGPRSQPCPSRPHGSSANPLGRSILTIIFALTTAVAVACGGGSGPGSDADLDRPTIPPGVTIQSDAGDPTASPNTDADEDSTTIPTEDPTPDADPPSETPTSTPTPAPTQEPACRVDISALNMREGPSTRYDVVGAALQDTQVAVTKRLADCSWLFGHVGEASGWFATVFLTCPFDPCALPIAESIPPTYTPSPTPTPTPTLPPSISFTADKTELSADECTQIRWNVSNVQSVMFEGDPVEPQGSEEVCPEEGTEYTLSWTHANGTTESAVITIQLEGITVPGGIPIILPTPDGPGGIIIDPGRLPFEPIRVPGRRP